MDPTLQDVERQVLACEEELAEKAARREALQRERSELALRVKEERLLLAEPARHNLWLQAQVVHASGVLHSVEREALQRDVDRELCVAIARSEASDRHLASLAVRLRMKLRRVEDSCRAWEQTEEAGARWDAEESMRLLRSQEICQAAASQVEALEGLRREAEAQKDLARQHLIRSVTLLGDERSKQRSLEAALEQVAAEASAIEEAIARIEASDA